MKQGDIQKAMPQVVFTDTKANIEALVGVLEGAHAYATDTDEPGWYDGAAWVWGGGGGATAFTDLTDAFASYFGLGGEYVKVKATEDGLETDIPAGGGDVLGPATSTDEHLAVWDGTDSKTLKDGGAVPAGGGNVSDTGATTANHLAVWNGASDHIIKDGGAVPAAGVTDAEDLTYTPAVNTDWDGDADPGNADDAFDQLAERVDDLEGASGPAFVGARYTSNAEQNIVNNAAVVIIDFEDQVYDTGSLVTTGAAWKFTAPSTGYYHINCLAMFATNNGWGASERVLLQLFKGGTAFATLDRIDGYTNAVNYNPTVQGAVTVYLAATNYIDVRIAQNSGADIKLVNDPLAVWINIEKVG